MSIKGVWLAVHANSAILMNCIISRHAQPLAMLQVHVLVTLVLLIVKRVVLCERAATYARFSLV